MTMRSRKFCYAACVAMLGLAPVLTVAAAAAERTAKLPGTLIWATNQVGDSGYVQAAAIADAFGKAYGTRIRLLPTTSAVGRILPVKQGKAAHAWLGNELFFATEGQYDFATRDWGPQNLRVLAGPPASYGLVTTKTSGIKTLADLKGKRIAFTTAHLSANLKTGAFMVGAGLKEGDYQLLRFPSYADSLRALLTGKADAAGANPSSTYLYELENSPDGIFWVPLPPDDKKFWGAVDKLAPIFEPVKEYIGAGLSKDKPADVLGNRFPSVTVYAEANADDVYNFIKALDETYDVYSQVNDRIKLFKLEIAGKPPIDAPFHDGAIRYLKEKGIWTAEHQAWNDARIVRMNNLQAAWKRAVAEGKSLDDAAFEKLWLKIHAEVPAIK